MEVDEMWSFVFEQWRKRWLWTVMCRVHVKSLPTPLGIEAKRLAVFSGSAFPQVIKAVKVSVIYGKLINWSSQQRRIIVLEKQKDKPITWSDGTTNSDNRALALFEKLYPFQNLTSCMKS